jgi:hypothetical protein
MGPSDHLQLPNPKLPKIAERATSGDQNFTLDFLAIPAVLATVVQMTR